MQAFDPVTRIDDTPHPNSWNIQQDPKSAPAETLSGGKSRFPKFGNETVATGRRRPKWDPKAVLKLWSGSAQAEQLLPSAD